MVCAALLKKISVIYGAFFGWSLTACSSHDRELFEMRDSGKMFRKGESRFLL
jgi:hypothetical protein